MALSTDSPKTILIRVKRRADEEVNSPNKRFKFVATSQSANDEHIYNLFSKTCSSLPESSRPANCVEKPEIQDYEEWSVKQNKKKEVITCNGRPLESANNQNDDSLEYLYDIYVYDDNLFGDEDNPQYKECEDTEEDSNDENYPYNDYPDEDEVSDEVIDYYQYSDLNADRRHNIDSDYDLSDEDEDQLAVYLKQKQLEESKEGDHSDSGDNDSD